MEEELTKEEDNDDNISSADDSIVLVREEEADELDLCNERIQSYYTVYDRDTHDSDSYLQYS